MEEYEYPSDWFIEWNFEGNLLKIPKHYELEIKLQKEFNCDDIEIKAMNGEDWGSIEMDINICGVEVNTIVDSSMSIEELVEIVKEDYNYELRRRRLYMR